jgi:hypothetical protein
MTMPEIPGLEPVAKVLQGAPMLFVLTIVVCAVLAMITFLSWKRSEQLNTQNHALLQLVKECQAKANGT